MPTFTVTQIIDGDTFAVTPRWTWNGSPGDRVRPAGYDAPEAGFPSAAAATAKLSTLILNKKVELGTAYRLDRGRLVCEVHFNGRNLKDYFPHYQ